MKIQHIGMRGVFGLIAFCSAFLNVRVLCAATFSESDFTWGAPTGNAMRDGSVLKLSVDSTGLFGLRGVLPASRLKGAQTIRATVRARGKDIVKPKLSYLGLKFQFAVRDRFTGTVVYPNTHTVRYGSFDWRELKTEVAVVGYDLEDVEILLGLQGVTGGMVEFDLSTLRVETQDDVFPKDDPTYRCVYSETMRRLPTLRGVMLPGGRDLTEGDFDTLRNWGVTLARYQMGCRKGEVRTGDDSLETFDRWMQLRLDHLERFVLPLAQRNGMRIAIDIHGSPGGRKAVREMKMFSDKAARDYFVSLWRRIALRFRGNPAVYCYDLINEPEQRGREPYDYWTVQRDAALAIREVDPQTPIALEANDMDSPVAFAYQSVLKLTNVIYEVHMYMPTDYTHQGVFDTPLGGVYQDETRGWNRDYLRKMLSRVREFQLRHGARIYVGEFSAIAWAKGAETYLADCISLFEEYGWDWTYHSFRGWPPWSVEHECTDVRHMRGVSDSVRKRALLDGFKRNTTTGDRK